MTQRIPCKVGGCERQILPATAKDTGGMCMPCHLGWGHPDRKPKRPAQVDRFAGVDDPVEILVRHFDAPKPDGTVYLDPPEPVHAYFERLTPAEQERLRDAAVDLIARGIRHGEQLAIAIACQTSAEVRPVQLALLDQERLLAPAAFAGAAADVRDRLLARLAVDDRGELWAVLEALAWCRDEVAVARFAGWRATPPPWWTRFAGELCEVTHRAGWELDERGAFRALTTDRCYELVERPDDGPSGAAGDGAAEQAGVRVTVRNGQACPSCRNPVYDLLRVRERAGVLAVPLCPACLYHVGPQRGVFDDAGRSRLLAPDEGADGGQQYDPLPEDALRRGRPRPPRWAIEWGAAPASQLGGHPTWVQSSEYPSCPTCRRTMRFVGQLDTEDLELGMEGFHYAFACRSCRTTAAVFQCS
jgi:hypothetical protein